MGAKAIGNRIGDRCRWNGVELTEADQSAKALFHPPGRQGGAEPRPFGVGPRRGAGCTTAARKFDRKLLHVFGVRLYLAGRTALIRGRMNRRDAGVILGSTPVISVIRSTADFRSRRLLGVREASRSWRAITSTRVGSLEIRTIFAFSYRSRTDTHGLTWT